MMTWKVLATAAVLQAQFPVTGKAGRTDGKNVSEILWACGAGGGQ